MKTAEHRVDCLVREELTSDSMTEEEVAVVWTNIEGQLGATPLEVMSIPRGPARKKFAVLATAGAALVLAAVALFPIWSDSGSNDLNIGSLESATASEVLAVTAEEASTESLFPGVGEQLYFRSVQISPSGTEAPQRIEEWIGPDGVGYRRDATRGGSSQGVVGGSTVAEPLTETFDASEGPDPRFGVNESWRAVLSMSQLESLSQDPSEALRELRRSVSKAVGRASDLSSDVHGFVGSDLIVLMTVTNLLTQAPLTGEQREAMFNLIETSPSWMRSDGSASAETSNLGESVSRTGQEGILIQTSINLSRVASAILGVNTGTWRLGILLDPTAGTVLEVRRSQSGDAAPYSLTTTERLEIVG